MTGLSDLEVSVRIKASETWEDIEHDYAGRSRTVKRKREGVELVNLGADFDSPETVAAVLRGIAERISPLRQPDVAATTHSDDAARRLW